MAARRNLDKPLEIGQAMADATMKRRRAAARTRRRALAQSPAPVSRRLTAAGTATTAAAELRSRSAGVLVAEGDSWFNYPFHDILSDLEDLHGYEVESVAHRGDTVEDMAYGGGQLDAFSRCVEKVLRRGATPKAILMSGGGNDIAGDQFGMLLNHAVSGIPGLNSLIVSGIIDERIHDAYATIMRAITAICETLIGQTVPILVHGYDYAVPDGRGFLGGIGPLPGPWLEPGFRQKGYQTIVSREPIVVQLIDRFNAMLAGLAGRPPFSHVKYVDLRNTLPNGSDYRRWWDNELHPTRKGFKAVTAKFVAAL
jgi:hypothetical protein